MPVVMDDSLHLLTDLIASARKAGATAADALWFESSALSVARRMHQLEELERSENRGISLRVFVGERMAVVSSSDVGSQALAELVTRALSMARLAPEDPYATLAPEALLARDVPDLDLYDPHEVTEAWLLEQCAKAEDTALAVSGITNSEGAGAATRRTHYALAASNGFANGYRSGYSSLSVSVLAGSGTGMERDYDFTSARYLCDLTAPETLGENASMRALAKLHPRKIATQQAPVVYDPRVSKNLLTAFAGAISGNAIARGASFLKGEMGKEIFSSSVSIMDDPHRLRGLSSRPFDAEGVRTGKRALVENGVLKTWLLDMRSANRLGLETTGHAYRSLSSTPSPASTNLYLEPGRMSPGELMGDIASGFYVTETIGMGINLVTGDYSQGASGFWIEKGEKVYPVSEVTIAGKLQEMFKNITPASDLEFRYGANAPTLRIEGMTVAGK